MYTFWPLPNEIQRQQSEKFMFTNMHAILSLFQFMDDPLYKRALRVLLIKTETTFSELIIKEHSKTSYEP